MNYKHALLGLALISTGLVSCKEEKPVPPGENIPSTYNFEPVNYKGQTVRLLLADTLMTLIKSTEKDGGMAVTKAQLEAIYDNSPSLFADISTNRKLSDKIFGGTGGALDLQMRAWFDTIAVRSAQFGGSAQAVTTADGLYLPQLIEKTLMGAVFYYNALDYMNEKVPVADNNTVKEGEGTGMQHNWDEAFGYFGATREYSNMSDDEISKNPSVRDANNDGKVDPTSERNFYFARYAGSRDKGFSVFTAGPTDYTKDIFEGFVKGRHYIGTKDYAKRDEAAAQVKSAWDKVIAASAINYAVALKNDISNPATNGRWAELLTFVTMTKYNSESKMNSVYNEVLALIGSKPADFTAEKAGTVIEKIKSAYSF